MGRSMIGYILLVLGIVILLFGLNSTQTVPETVVKEVTGRFTEGTMWYILGGIAMIIAGSCMATFRKKF